MSKTMSFLAGLFLTTILVVGAAPAFGQQILLKVQIPGTEYCHLKFPEIDGKTLHSTRPTLSDPKSGAIVDYYGPCNYDPAGNEEVTAQRRIAMLDENDSE